MIAPPWEFVRAGVWLRPWGIGSLVRINAIGYGDPLCGEHPTYRALGWLPPNRGDSDLWTPQYATPAEAQRDIDDQLRALGWTVDECEPIETPALVVPFIGPLPVAPKGSVHVVEMERMMRSVAPFVQAAFMESLMHRPCIPWKILPRDKKAA